MTLEATYDQILSKIPSADAQDAVKLLLWLAFAKEPLQIDYLAIVVEYDIEKKTFDSDAKLSSPQEILKICSSLVTRMDNGTVQLAHASVKQYILEKKRGIQPNVVMDPSLGDRFIGQCCLTYLLESKASYTHTINEKSLIAYSAIYWTQHILAAHQELAAIEQIKKLFKLTSFAFQNWVRMHNDACNYTAFAENMDDSSPLHCAAYHGLVMTAEWLLPRISRDSEIIKALCAAAQNAHLTTVQVLVTKNPEIDIDACGAKVGNALQVATYHGHKDIVELLVKTGADVNAKTGEYGTALQAASAKGYKNIVEWLVERGADVNAQGGWHGNALHAALH